MVKEDDIHHTILSTISLNKTLMDWKHRLKITILKKIKERDIFTCIPESETIQNVINKLYPMIFSSKEKAKYFLTIIGDVVLKKTSETYFINSKAKNFLKELNIENKQILYVLRLWVEKFFFYNLKLIYHIFLQLYFLKISPF